MEDYARIEKLDLRYRYEFSTDELDAMAVCLDAHGFAIIQDVLPPDLVEDLKQAVYEGTDPERKPGPGQSGTRHAWVESGPGAWAMMEYEPFMRISRYLVGSDELTIHRSAANCHNYI